MKKFVGVLMMLSVLMVGMAAVGCDDGNDNTTPNTGGGNTYNGKFVEEKYVGTFGESISHSLYDITKTTYLSPGSIRRPAWTVGNELWVFDEIPYKIATFTDVNTLVIDTTYGDKVLIRINR